MSDESADRLAAGIGAKHRARRTIRWAILGDLLVTVLLLALCFVALSLLVGRRAVTELADLAIERTMDQVLTELDRFVDPVAAVMEQMRRWWDAQVVDLRDETRLVTLLQPHFDRTPHLSAVILADDGGDGVMVDRCDETGVLRVQVHDARGGRQRVALPGSSSQWRELAAEADWRTRPWFLRAIELLADQPEAERFGAAGWTEPYVFLTKQRLGITAATAFRSEAGERRVVAADVLLDAVDDFTRTLMLGDRGQAAILSADGVVIGHPRDTLLGEVAEEGVRGLRSAGEIDLPLGVSPEGLHRTTGVRRFRSGGEHWWGEVAPHPIGKVDRLFVAVAIPERELLRGFSMLRSLTLLVMLGILAAAITRSLWLATRFSRPIRGLVDETERFTRGDLEPGPPLISDVEELIRLSDAHERMRLGLIEMMRMERDLRIARGIQKRTMPDQVPAVKGFDIAVWNDPADETGGDMYDVIPCFVGEESDALPERLVLLLADATGHGIGPALSVMQVRAMVRMGLRMSMSLFEIIDRLNRQLLQDLGQGRFVTAWFGELDPKRRSLRVFSAGQGPIFRYRASDRCVESLPADTVPLGVLEDLDVAGSAPAPWRLEPGDIIAVISDGILEATDSGGRQFGAERVMELIERHCEEPAETIVRMIREAVDVFRGSGPRDDDATMVVLRASA